MNVKMLEMQYGDLEHCPPVITGKLLEKEAGSYTEDLKRRLRYLCHLPLTCQFELAEIELRPPLVSEHVLRAFRGNCYLLKYILTDVTSMTHSRFTFFVNRTIESEEGT